LCPQIPLITIKEDPFITDLLDFKDSVEKTAFLIPHLVPPFTIGIYGNWGAGKTSYMEMLRAVLDQRSDDKTFWFNAWEYENELSLLIPLLSKLTKELAPKSKVGVSLKRMSTALALSGSDILLKLVTLNTSNLSDIERYFSRYEEHIGDKYWDIVHEIDKLKSDFRNLVNNICSDTSKLVIFIDDLDRCLPENVINLLENIKHFLSVEGAKCVFVLGVDRNVLSAAIKA